MLTPGQPIDVTIRVRAPSNVPLDLFFVQDLTQSFDDDEDRERDHPAVP